MAETKITMEELKTIREEMDVLDRSGEKVGTVEKIQFGTEDFTRPGAESATAPAHNETRTLVDDFAEAIAPPETVAEEVRERMERFGFIKIDRGLLRGDRYVMLNQVARIDGDEVLLTIGEDDLVNP